MNASNAVSTLTNNEKTYLVFALGAMSERVRKYAQSRSDTRRTMYAYVAWLDSQEDLPDDMLKDLRTGHSAESTGIHYADRFIASYASKH